MSLTLGEAELLADRFTDLLSGMCPHRTTHRTLQGCLNRELRALSNAYTRKRILEFEQGWRHLGDTVRAKPV